MEKNEGVEKLKEEISLLKKELDEKVQEINSKDEEIFELQSLLNKQYSE